MGNLKLAPRACSLGMDDTLGDTLTSKVGESSLKPLSARAVLSNAVHSLDQLRVLEKCKASTPDPVADLLGGGGVVDRLALSEGVHRSFLRVEVRSHDRVS
jgi:hypothetical protein